MRRAVAIVAAILAVLAGVSTLGAEARPPGQAQCKKCPSASPTPTPTPTPTPSPSPSPSPSPTPESTSTPTPTPTPTPEPTPEPSPSPTPTSEPTPGIWTSPEGVRIDIQTTAGGWTHERIYSILKANALDLELIGPKLRIIVQDQHGSASTIAASSSGGVYSSVSATIGLDARPYSGFTARPDDIIAHEYGHVWFHWYEYLTWQGSQTAYLANRWVTADGSVTLASDDRTGTTYSWSPTEIAADDYRLLFGSPLAISQRNASLNQRIVDPRNQPGLREWFLTTWRTGR